MSADNPRLYTELAKWWHLFSPPSHYVEEATDLLPELLGAADPPPRTLLELGSGAGSLALQWNWDPDPAAHTYEVAWAFLLRESDGTLRVESDRHQFGLFPRAAWLEIMREVGFVPRSRLDPWGRDVFVGRKP